jgi:hypothetical protein
VGLLLQAAMVQLTYEPITSRPMMCVEFMSAAGAQLCECTVGIAARVRDRLCPALTMFLINPCGGCEGLFDQALLVVGVLAAVMWLVLPHDWWSGLCGFGMGFLSITCFALWRALRE